MTALMPLLFPLCRLDGVHAGPIASEAERKACPFYQQMTCLLDVMEKACEPDEGPPHGLIAKGSTESAWMCCCPMPYEACKKAERAGSCDAAFGRFVEPLGPSSTATDIREALQRVRGAMRKAGGEPCEALAAEEPLSTCGFEASPQVERSLARTDLFCEMLTWQREELGDGNEEEFSAHGCPWPTRTGEGDNRKGTRLDQAEL
eukprot:CAMPEP_0179110336 /NCGR_PEP_ID=MMETSP0796-20121207/51488_1 /TAXON_ID=73915 /ORGANISM="Pyrodinium bahamense, Strain pbaha01" /LENGTH=203 /DNA_ID=CAMNT_0020808465 /DNA_START=92 /DNA_END=703 /DNA_ORIENTATION=-